MNRTTVTKLKDGQQCAVDLDAVMLAEPITNGTRLYIGAMGNLQLEVKEQVAQLWPPPRDIAAEVAKASDPARQAQAADALATATPHPVDAPATMAATVHTEVNTEAAAPPPAPIIGMPSAPVFVDPAIWEKRAAEARQKADEARARADEAAAAATSAHAAVTDIGAQMEAQLRAQGVRWPTDPTPAAPAAAPIEEPEPDRSAHRTATKKAAKKAPAKKAPAKKKARR